MTNYKSLIRGCVKVRQEKTKEQRNKNNSNIKQRIIVYIYIYILINNYIYICVCIYVYRISKHSQQNSFQVAIGKLIVQWREYPTKRKNKEMVGFASR